MRLNHRVEVRQLPFELVQSQISEYLEEVSWRLSVTQYIKILAVQANIQGVRLEQVSTPLVQ